MTSLKTSIKTITYLSDIGCLEIQGASLDCHSIAYYDIHTLPLISCGHQKIVPFAALIKADGCIISKIASYSGFAVTAFLRIKDRGYRN